MDTKTVQTNQLRNFKGQHLLVLGKYNAGDYWLVCRVIDRPHPRCQEEFQTSKEGIVAQYTLTATMSDRWLRFFSKVEDWLTDQDTADCRKLFDSNTKELPIPQELQEKVGPEWSWQDTKEQLLFMDAIVQKEYQDFLSILEPVEA